MLRITLYKNCILNETYQNVISTGDKNGKSVLERYLDTLTKYPLEDLEDVYYENNGILNFDLSLVNVSDIYEYNYMKILYYDEDENLLLTRYCFIQHIEIKNEIVILRYTEDIFSSYSNKITKITESYLSKCRKLRYSNKTIQLHTLPVDYDGNEFLNRQSLYDNTTVRVFARIQYYETQPFGVVDKNRNYKLFMVHYYNENENADTEIMTIQQAIKIMNDMIRMMSTQYFRTEFGGDAYYYAIQEFIIVPNNFISTSINNSFNPALYQTGVDDHGDPIYNPKYRIILSGSSYQAYLREFKEEESAKPKVALAIEKQNNFKLLSVGTFNTQIPIVNNGTSVKYNIEFVMSNNDFKICMNVQNQYIDLSNDFIYVVPFQSVLGEENFSQYMNRFVKNMDNSISIIASMFTGGITSGISQANISGLSKQANRLANSFTSTGNGLIGSNYKFDKLVNLDNSIRTLEGNRNISNIKNFNESGNGLLSLMLDNIPVYSSLKGTFAKSDGLINSLFGVMEYYINSDNDDFVLKSVNNLGYTVYEYCDNLSMVDFNNPNNFINDNINYDVIQFERINVIGSFPRSIALMLNSIFENGFKIWYNENLQDDNLEVR